MTRTATSPPEAPIDLRPPRPCGASAPQPGPARGGPIVRIVLGAVATGVLGAGALILGVLPGAPEHVTTGAALLAFAAGAAMFGALSRRLTDFPQRWANVLAALLAVAGLVLLAAAPSDDGMRGATWVWPPVLLIVLTWSARQIHVSVPGRIRWLLYLVLVALALASVGALVDNVGLERDASTLSMPGVRYDVGGHRLHLRCTGSGGPTVVLESGLGGSSPLWAPVAAGTAGTTRVCAYDRAGQGWSDDAPGPRDSLAVVADLHRLLAVAGEPGPYVLVGHSVGGVYAMTYAARYPEQVAGLVLLDSASPRQFAVLPDYPRQYAMMTRLYGLAPTLARLGVARLVPALSANNVPGVAGRQATAFASSPRGARNARDELTTYRRSFAQAQALTTLGGKPLVVVSTSESLSGTAGWAAAQQQLAALSSNTDRRTVDSSHVGLLDNPTGVPYSVAAITGVVRAVRTGTRVGTP